MSHPRQTIGRSAGNTVTAAPASGSQTILQTIPDSPGPPATLRLRAEPEPARRIQWAEDVVDNEGLGKKSSKVCCIYHKPHKPGDSSSESDSSSSDEDSESEPDLSRARRAGGKGKRGKKEHTHDHDEGESEGGSGKGKGKERKPSPNAYERQPKYKSKKNT